MEWRVVSGEGVLVFVVDKKKRDVIVYGVVRLRIVGDTFSFKFQI